MYTILFSHFFFFLLHGRALGLHCPPYPPPHPHKETQDTQSGNTHTVGAKKKKKGCSAAQKHVVITARLKKKKIHHIVVKAA